MGRIRRHWKGLLASGVIVVAVLAVGVPYVYIHWLEGDQPARLSLKDVRTGGPGSSGGSTSSSLTGTWTVGAGSRAGYRVHETLAGQGTTAVGRTSKVTGSLTMRSSTVSAARFVVQVASITSDRSERDAQFRGRIMDASRYPTASFVLTKPIELGSVPPVGRTVDARATGRLTMHGTTNTVSFPVQAERTASSIAVTGDIDVQYGKYHIDNPSFGSFVSVGERGTVEFLLVARR